MSLFSTGPEELLPEGGSALYFPWVLGDLSWSATFERLLEETPWEAHTIRMFGKVYDQPRLVAWYGDPGSEYSYSGVRMTVHPWTDLISKLKGIVETTTDASFNSVLLNFYRDGDDKVAWHRDNEPELGPQPLIASLSLGAARRFKFRHLTSGLIVEKVLESGSLVVMSGLSQTCWEHEVPRQRAVRGGRINLTFRRVRAGNV